MELMLLEKFIVNGKVQIVNSNKTTFNGFVKAINETSFTVQMITAQPNFRPIQLDERVEFLVSFETEAYRCASIVLDVKVSDQAETMLLTVPEIVLRVERRQFIRLDAILPVSYYLIPENEFYKSSSSIPYGHWKRVKNTFTIDISGGGIRMITYEPSEIGRGAVLILPLSEEIKTLSSVTRVEKEVRNNNFITAFKFEDIKQEHRDLIINYVKKKTNQQ